MTKIGTFRINRGSLSFVLGILHAVVFVYKWHKPSFGVLSFGDIQQYHSISVRWLVEIMIVNDYKDSYFDSFYFALFLCKHHILFTNCHFSHMFVFNVWKNFNFCIINYYYYYYYFYINYHYYHYYYYYFYYYYYCYYKIYLQ